MKPIVIPVRLCVSPLCVRDATGREVISDFMMQRAANRDQSESDLRKIVDALNRVREIT